MDDSLKRKLMSIDILSRLKKSGMFNSFTARLLQIAQMKSDPSREYEQLETVIALSTSFHSPFPMPDESVDGPIRFAFSENNQLVGFYPHECHILCSGQTGIGKSILMKIIVSQILHHNNIDNFYKENNEIINFWMFVKSPEMRSLLNIEKNILIIPFKDVKNKLKLNLLEPPPGINAMDWANIIADILIQLFWLNASKDFLIDCLQKLYTKYTAFGYYPSLFDLYNYVKSLKIPQTSRIARYQESILNRVGGLIHSSLGPVLDCSRGHAQYLINHHVIFEILYLTMEQQVLMVNYLLTYLYIYKLNHETNLRHMAIVDDSNIIFDSASENRPDLGLPIIHHLISTVRKANITVFACTQTPHQVGSSIHSNSFAKIMFSLSNGKDVECMFQSMGIKDPDQKAYCYKIKPREAIVKFSGRYQEPFLVRIPEVEL